MSSTLIINYVRGKKIVQNWSFSFEVDAELPTITLPPIIIFCQHRSLQTRGNYYLHKY